MEPNKPEENQQDEPQNTAQPQAETNPYQPSEASQAEAKQLTHDERQFAMFCHFAAFAGLIIPLGSIIGPLVMWLIKKDESAFINYHGKEALNFNITMALVSIVCFVLIFVVIGILLLPLVMIFWLVMVIIAGIKANDGIEYRYPFSLRLVS